MKCVLIISILTLTGFYISSPRIKYTQGLRFECPFFSPANSQTSSQCHFSGIHVNSCFYARLDTALYRMSGVVFGCVVLNVFLMCVSNNYLLNRLPIWLKPMLLKKIKLKQWCLNLAMNTTQSSKFINIFTTRYFGLGFFYLSQPKHIFQVYM